MLQANPPAAKKGGCPIGCVILVVLAVLVVVVGAAGVFLYLNVFAPKPAAILTNISSPADGYLAEINVPLTVQATAEHPAGIVRVEVYADGALVLAQDSTAPDGSSPFILMKTWAPLVTGRHLLTARAYTRDGNFGDSSVVDVDVVPVRELTTTIRVESSGTIPALNDIVASTGVTLPRLLESNPDLTNRDPATPLDPGSEIHIPRSPAPVPSPDAASGSDSSDGPPAPLPDAPTPPTNLSANADCASVQLIWTDSPNEEQYAVYRLAPSASRFDRIASSLPMNTTSYRDSITVPGEYHYRVAAVRHGLEGFIQATARTPDACRPTAPPATPDLLLSFLSIDTATRYPGIYCYITVDGRAEHVPSGDFNRLLHDADGLHYDMRLLDNRGQFVLSHRDTQPVTLQGDCYGDASIGGSGGSGGVWREDWLGHFAATHPSTDWNGQVREFGIAGDRTFRFRYSLGRRGAVSAGVGSAADAEVATPPRVEYLDLPVPSRIGILLPMGAICPDPSRCPVDVTWSWAGNDFFSEDSLTGFRLVEKITDLTQPGHPTRELGRWDIPGGRNRSTNLPAFAAGVTCGARYDFALLAYQFDPTSGIIRESRWSEPFQWFLNECRHEADVRVTLKKLVFNSPSGATDIRDNEYCSFAGCRDNRLEISGGVAVYNGLNLVGGINRLPIFPVWPGGPCPPRLFCTGRMSYGDTSDVHSPWDVLATSAVRSDSDIKVNVGLVDNNFTEALDRLCVGSVTFRRRTAAEWQTTDEEIEFTNDYGEASCRVVVRVQGQAAH